MRIIKLGVISVIFLFFLLTLISLLIPSTVHISRAIDIKGTATEAEDFIRDSTKRSLWLPIQFVDTAYEVIMEGEAPKENIVSRSGNPVSFFRIIPASQPNLITFQWSRTFKLSWYPWEKFSAITYDKRYGAEMEKQLEKLKVNLEKDGR